MTKKNTSTTSVPNLREVEDAIAIHAKSLGEDLNRAVQAVDEQKAVFYRTGLVQGRGAPSTGSAPNTNASVSPSTWPSWSNHEGCFYREFQDRLGIEPKFRFHINDLRSRKEVLQWYLDLNTGGTVHSDDEIEKVRGLLEKLDSHCRLW